MMKIIIGLILSVLFLASCTNEVVVDVPEFSDGSILDGSIPLTSATKSKIEGVYEVTQGADHFGEQVVIKWSKNLISIFCEKNAAYLILETGSIGDEIHLEGYWRFARGEETGLSRLIITADSGGRELLTDTSQVETILLNGLFGNDNNNPEYAVSFNYKRPISSAAKNKEFFILAHRGGGRTADHLPASENTLEMINLAERYGANGIEIDVKLSEDNVSFLYHDKSINLRLVQKSTIWGPIEDFNFAQLKTLLTLINGEKIPTLRLALEFVLRSTSLEFVWLDMKSTKNDVAQVAEIQKEILERAEAMGRNLNIYMGLPTDDKVEHFYSYPDWESVPSLNEFEPDDVRATESEVWGPRWTLGLQLDRVEQMHSEGKKVVTWTMDEPPFIKEYLKDGDFDGMVTNYPTLVAYYRYVIE